MIANKLHVGLTEPTRKVLGWNDRKEIKTPLAVPYGLAMFRINCGEATDDRHVTSASCQMDKAIVETDHKLGMTEDLSCFEKVGFSDQIEALGVVNFGTCKGFVVTLQVSPSEEYGKNSKPFDVAHNTVDCGREHFASGRGEARGYHSIRAFDGRCGSHIDVRIGFVLVANELVDQEIEGCVNHVMGKVVMHDRDGVSKGHVLRSLVFVIGEISYLNSWVGAKPMCGKL